MSRRVPIVRERATDRSLRTRKVAPHVDEHAELTNDALVVTERKIEVHPPAIEIHQNRGADDVPEFAEDPAGAERRRPEGGKPDTHVKVLILVVERSVPEHECRVLPRVGCPQLQARPVLANPADLSEEELRVPEVLEAVGGEDVLDASVIERKPICFEIHDVIDPWRGDHVDTDG